MDAVISSGDLPYLRKRTRPVILRPVLRLLFDLRRLLSENGSVSRRARGSANILRILRPRSAGVKGFCINETSGVSMSARIKLAAVSGHVEYFHLRSKYADLFCQGWAVHSRHNHIRQE